MSLLALQSAFRDEIAADDDGIAPSSVGMAIYRNAYRGRLLAALETSFERTRRWTGEDAFTAAACHYVLTVPSTRWTLDSYGSEFPQLLQALFAGDPEVAELAWLEWHMSQAFAAPDGLALAPETLGSAGLSDSDWDRLGFAMAPGFACRLVMTNCTELWTALAADPAGTFVPLRTDAEAVVVWRTDLIPHFRVIGFAEHQALAALADGRTLGQVAADTGPTLLGSWLAGWLSDGLLGSYSINRQ